MLKIILVIFAVSVVLAQVVSPTAGPDASASPSSSSSSTPSLPPGFAPLSPPTNYEAIAAQYEAWNFILNLICLPAMVVILFAILISQIVSIRQRKIRYATFRADDGESAILS